MTTLSPRELLAPKGRPEPKPGTYYIQTWGCQMNEEDSEQMALYLQDLGFTPVNSVWEAQIVLLNTCSVRKKPEDKAFSLMGELRSLKSYNPEMVLGVCGCMAQTRANEIRHRNPHVDFVLGTGDLALLPGLVTESLQTRRFRKRTELPERKGKVVTDIPRRHLGRTGKLKAFVPIQYGCDKFCTYCIVPKTRGRERSRPTAEILEEVRKLADQGTVEITLLGQTVNSYGKNLLEGNVPFAQLLWQISEIPGIERIRYTSPYPRDFSQELVETIRDCPAVMENVHLPLQSGDDEVLREMRRVYTVESFKEIATRIRETVPGVTFSTDIIVGFPGETEAQFENTCQAVRDIRFDAAFTFAYSTRPGTPAGDCEDQIPREEKLRRLAHLIEVQNDITRDINVAYVGQELEVLFDSASPKWPGTIQGYSREFKLVQVQGSEDRIGRIAKVKVTESHLWGFSGTLV